MNERMNNLEMIISMLKEKHRENKVKVIITDAYKCQLCGFILNNPCQTECGCLFCKQCIETWLINRNHCPVNGEECRKVELHSKKGVHEDRARAREISQIKVQCVIEGCEEMIEINKMSNHMDVCLCRTRLCPTCGKTVLEKVFENHKEEECEERKVRCKFCNETMTSRVLDSEHNNDTHVKLCVRYIGKCPYACGLRGDVLIVDHRHTCLNRPLRCALREYGCTAEEFNQQTLNKHNQDSVWLHAVVMAGLYTRRNERIRQMQDSVSDLEIELTQLRLLLDVVNREKTKKAKISRSEHSHLYISDEDIVWRNGEFLWKVENFSDLINIDKQAKDICITSEPFYSSDFGYKMCLKMYPNGDGHGRSTHLSLYFSIMKGRYDEILPWPFNLRVKLSLLSNCDSVEDHSQMFIPDGRKECYDRPKTLINVGSGSPTFINRSDLEKTVQSINIALIRAVIMQE